MNEEQTHEYHLVLPEALMAEIQQIAKDKRTTPVELLRRFIKLGLVAIKIENEPDAALIVREGNDEREITFLP